MTNFNQPGNSGIAVDSCGNVYVGSGDRVIKYDANLTQLSQTTLPFAVFDVVVAPGGNVVVCGATGSSSSTSRTGYLQSINMSACHPFALICCNTTICPAGPFCLNDPAAMLISETSGGTWSGPGVNPSTGLFMPSAAGIGSHTITYTLPCGSSSITIKVNPCVPLTVCQTLTGDMMVSGGTGPYNWQQWSPATSFPITNQAECQSCGYTWNALMGMCLNGMMPVTTCNMPAGWSTFATGNTTTPPGTWPIRVIDANGDSAIINSLASLPACSACPPFTFNITNIINVCPGLTNGSFTVTTGGGTSPYDYLLKNPSGNIIASYNNVSGAQTFTSLPAGTYNLVAVDSDTCRDSSMVTITQPTPINIQLTPVDEHCANSCTGSATALVTGGDSPYTYAWNNGQDSAVIHGLCAGTYTVTVTDSNACHTTATTAVGSAVAISADFTADPASGSVPLNVFFDHIGTGAVQWYWNFGDGDVSNDENPVHVYDSTGIYTVTLIVSSGPPDFCQDTTTMIIDVQKPSRITVPNVFTPNNDGHNDEFIMDAKEIKTFSCSIYNRWGKKVFEWSDINKGWDGKTRGGCAAADGVYYFIIQAVGTDEAEYDISGTVTLLR